MEVLKVSSKSKPKSVAGAVTASLQNDGAVKLLAIGAGAVNQACKSIAVTKGYVAPKGVVFNVDISFGNVNIDGENKTAMEFTLTSNTQ